MLPSSRMISHSTAAGASPASRARSQHASVCPARTSTPPGCAISGKTWPGCTTSLGLAFSAAATLMVRARSCAEMPVEMPSAASIDTVKFVPWRERFCSTIGRRPRRWARSSVIGMQMRPRPCVARKLTLSAETNSAANTRSPSFSRSSSSTRTTMCPARISAMISAMGAMAAASRRMPRFYSVLLLRPGLRSAGFLAGFAGFLADPRRFAGAAAQVVELRAAHFAFALHLDGGYERRVGLERALHALSGGDLAHDEGRVEAAIALRNYHALERLHALSFAFHHVHADDDGIAGREIRNGALEPLDFFLLDLLDQVHDFAPLSCSCRNSSSNFVSSAFILRAEISSGRRSHVRPS